MVKSEALFGFKRSKWPRKIIMMKTAGMGNRKLYNADPPFLWPRDVQYRPRPHRRGTRTAPPWFSTGENVRKASPAVFFLVAQDTVAMRCALLHSEGTGWRGQGDRQRLEMPQHQGRLVCSLLDSERAAGGQQRSGASTPG